MEKIVLFVYDSQVQVVVLDTAAAHIRVEYRIVISCKQELENNN